MNNLEAPRLVTRLVLVAMESPAVEALVAGHAPTHRERLDTGSDVVAAAAALAEQHSGETVVFEADVQAIGVLLCHAMGVPAAAIIRFVIDEDAISVVELDGEGRWAVLRVNEGRALPGSR